MAGQRDVRHELRPAAGRLVAALVCGLLGLLGTAAVSGGAQAIEPPGAQQPGCAVPSDRPAHGTAALDDRGVNLAKVAALNDMPLARLRELLRTDPTVWIDTCGRIYYVDPPSRPQGEAPARATPAAIPLAFSSSQTFLLHSRPGSDRVIHLDFDGEVVSGTAWNTPPANPIITAPPYDTDGSPSTFSDAELAEVQDIWARVAEDYAPFDVDVTTQDPGVAAIDRSNFADQVYGTRAVITSMAPALCVCGGVAYLSSFDDAGPDHAYFQPAWVFQTWLSNPKDYAEVASHEVGHTLALNHDGLTTVPGDDYYRGHASWAPIMGSGYYRPIVQWSKGEYPNASNKQDDVAVIATHGAPLRADDHGDTLAAALPLPPSLAASGVIGKSGQADSDWFSFAGSGAITVTVTPAAVSPDLDVGLELWSATQLLATAQKADPVMVSEDVATGLDATISMTLPTAGTYFARVFGTGFGSLATGFSDYGSMGQYTITVAASICPPDDPFEPNDTRGTATQLAGGQAVPGIACNDDHYAVSALAGQLVTANLTLSHANGNLDMALYDPSGTMVASSTGSTDGESIVYTAPAAGTYVIRVYPSTGAPDRNRYTLDVTLTGADVAVTLADSPDPVAAGAQLTYSATVTNNGPPDAAGVTFVDTLPAGAALVSAVPSQGSCAGSTIVTCSLEAIPAGGSATVTLVARPNDPGPLDNAATVSTPNDLDPSNDTATVRTTVLPNLVVGGFGVPAVAGTPGTITVTATGGSGAAFAGYRGTVHFESSDPAAVLPADHAFGPADSGSHAFTITFMTAGTRSVTATDTTTASITGSQAGIVVQATFPGAPRDVTATPGNASAVVAWNAPAFNGGTAITRYDVTSVPDGRTCLTFGALTCPVTGLRNGQDYTFTVTARNTVGTGPASSPSAPVTPATIPGAPRSVTGQRADAQVAVSWLPPTSNGGSPITAYTVTSAPGPATCATAGALGCTVTGLANGTSYRFTVTATNAVGVGPPSAASPSVTPATTPGAPTGVAGTASGPSVTVTWTAPGSNGGSAITGYRATASPGSSTCTTAAATSCVIGPLGDSSYTFVVVATNAVGDGLPSGASAPVRVDTTPPSAALTAPAVSATRAIAVTVTGTDPGGGTIAAFALVEGTIAPAAAGPGWGPAAAATFMLSAGNGPKTLSAFTRDTSGNVSLPSTRTVTLAAAPAMGLAVGSDHACAIVGSRVRCWGSNAFGQLGDGTQLAHRLPAPVTNLLDASALAAGTGFTCALLSDGTVRCWGANARGQLGDGTTTGRMIPVVVKGIDGARAITAGSSHACVLLSNGKVKCWGANASGQLGDGTKTTRTIAVTVRNLTAVRALVAGAAHSCAVTGTSRAVRCWGANAMGQLGDGTLTLRKTPVTVRSLTRAVSLAAGAGHTCARLSSGGAKCWGDNAKGQLGDGTLTRRKTPVTAKSLAGATQLAAGAAHTCALLATGTARCWGDNANGQLGDGTTTRRKVAVAVKVLAGAGGIAGGGSSSCAVDPTPAAWCWGRNSAGQLGDGTLVGRTIPVAVAGLTAPPLSTARDPIAATPAPGPAPAPAPAEIPLPAPSTSFPETPGARP